MQASSSSRPSRRLPRIGGALGVLLVLAGAGAAVWFADDRPAMATGPTPTPPVPVQIVTATREDVPIYLSGLGTVQAFNTVTIKTRVDGELQEVRFSEGQLVKKGDLLAVIDPRPFQAALDEAVAKVEQDEANLANAKVVLERDSKLTAKQFTTVETTDNQRALVAQLQAQLALDQAAKSSAATQLSYTQLTSPLDGRTGIRMVDQGNIIHATDTTGLVVITQTEPISVISTLPEDDLALVRNALLAGTVEVAAFTADGAANLGSGTLSLIDNQIDQTTGTIRLKSTFPNADEKLWPGQFVQLRLLQTIERNVVTVPSQAVQRGQGGFFVYVAKSDATVEARQIETGQIADGRAIIASGIEPGERVVTAGQYRLEPGLQISDETARDLKRAAEDR
jgi:membrane fusion protein, multidrug efflux system